MVIMRRKNMRQKLNQPLTCFLCGAASKARAVQGVGVGGSELERMHIWGESGTVVQM